MIQKLKHMYQFEPEVLLKRTVQVRERMQLFADFKLVILKNFVNSTGKRPCWSFFLKESGTKTDATVSNKYQIQLKKSICYRKNTEAATEGVL